ncbi:MAG: dienelactone hydrolase family protein [Proteobacteria bacterium]|nr:dienelactone hydrolase family protein [Pseudomonadota bacterium]
MCDLFGCGNSTDKPLPLVTDEARRNFLKGIAALPLAAVLAYPELARAAARAVRPFAIPLVAGEVTGFVAMPEKKPAPTLLLVHEWWGLNDNIKAVAAEFAAQGYIAAAIDLYGGKVATTRAEAKEFKNAVDPEKATEHVKAIIQWLSRHRQGNRKVGTIGWCFGGGWSLNASLAAPVDATVIYYGDVKKKSKDLELLTGPVMGHFGTQDKRINAKMVSGFEKSMKKAGKKDLTVHWYVADHAFANPTGARYDADDAALAWARTLAFFEKNLR